MELNHPPKILSEAPMPVFTVHRKYFSFDLWQSARISRAGLAPIVNKGVEAEGAVQSNMQQNGSCSRDDSQMFRNFGWEAWIETKIK